MSSGRLVTIHGSQWEYDHVKDEVAYWSRIELQKKKYSARDALVDRSGGSSSPYVGQRFDPQMFELVSGGWKHDHCEICTWALFESDDPDEGIGYTDDRGNWVCLECFSQFLKKESNQPPEPMRAKGPHGSS